MALSAVIVDDEQLAREELAYLLRDLDVDVVAQGKNGMEADEPHQRVRAGTRLS